MTVLIELLILLALIILIIIILGPIIYNYLFPPLPPPTPTGSVITPIPPSKLVTSTPTVVKVMVSTPSGKPVSGVTVNFLLYGSGGSQFVTGARTYTVMTGPSGTADIKVQATSIGSDKINVYFTWDGSAYNIYSDQYETTVP